MITAVSSDIDISLSDDTRRKLGRDLNRLHEHHQLLADYEAKLKEAEEIAQKLEGFDRNFLDVRVLQGLQSGLHNPHYELFSAEGEHTVADLWKDSLRLPFHVVHEDERLSRRHGFKLMFYELDRRIVVATAHFGRLDKDWHSTTLAVGFRFQDNQIDHLVYQAAFDFEDPDGDTVPYGVLEELRESVEA